MECYSNEHLMWSFVIGFPILVIWVIATPILALILLVKNIKKEEDNKIKQYMLILYQGLKPERFYWEFVNSLRKVLILMSFALFVTFPALYKIMISLIILLTTFRIQVKLQPYKDEKNNEIEILALLAGTLTLFSGLVFSSDEEQKLVLNAIILIFVMVINLSFLINWSYLFVLCMSEKYKIFKKILVLISVFLCKKYEKESK